MQNDIYMLWLSSMVSQLGSYKLNAILENFGTARDAFYAKTSQIFEEIYFSENAKRGFLLNHNLQYIEALLSQLQSSGIAYFSRENQRYPALLREIPDPPVGIFCIGELPPDNTHKVAVIGSRKCSEYGLMAARVLSEPLAAAGVVIVSGMARGVDSMAHRGAIDGGGKTIAVLGCGVDVCYPAENSQLREEIIANGAILSEYPPGTRPERSHFPARNRIISGLSNGVVVAEAGVKSGTLITVNQAADQGREVFAVPGSIASRLSDGTNRLISEGAIPVADHKDILFHLKIAQPSEEPPKKPRAKKNAGAKKISTDENFPPVEKIPPTEISPKQTEQKKHLAPEEKQVYDSLSFEPVSIDAILEATNLPLGRVLFLCTQLEIKGIIRKISGSRYVKEV